MAQRESREELAKQLLYEYQTAERYREAGAEIELGEELGEDRSEVDHRQHRNTELDADEHKQQDFRDRDWPPNPRLHPKAQ